MGTTLSGLDLDLCAKFGLARSLELDLTARGSNSRPDLDIVSGPNPSPYLAVARGKNIESHLKFTHGPNFGLNIILLIGLNIGLDNILSYNDRHDSLYVGL